MQQVRQELLNFVTAYVSGAKFETFAKRLFEIEYGQRFTPLGGIHDGGADGILLAGVQECVEEPNTFVQFSATKEEVAQTKIVQTVAALIKTGRNPVQVIYGTSQRLPKQDRIVEHVFSKHKVLAAIRDLEWIEKLINSNSAANDAFHQAFAPEINGVLQAASPLEGKVNEFVSDPTVFAFLSHQLADRFSQEKLHKPIVDALIFWALRATDPDSTPKRLMNRGAVSTALVGLFPNAKSVIAPHLDERLKELSRKVVGEIERLRYYRKEDSFCLPFEMREHLAASALQEVDSQENFRSSIAERLSAMAISFIEKEKELCKNLIFDSVHGYFVEQGLVLAAFLEKKLERLDIRDQVLEDELRKALSGRADVKKGDITPSGFGACLRVLRGIFYEPSPGERHYLSYLSRTSMLFNTLQSSPKIIEYFSNMAGNYRLLVGTDMLVKALAETYLPDEQKQITNLLKIAAEMGATLVLTAPVLDEVLTHIHAADLEFRNHYSAREQYLSSAAVSQCNRILIRTYFFAKGKIGGPKSWWHLINSIVDPDALRARSVKANQDLMNFLLQRFKMRWMPEEDLAEGVDRREVNKLTDQLIEVRPDKHMELSYNDALITYAIYALRAKGRESALHDGFGYRTWWLTKEVTVLSKTGMLVASHGGVPYVMRPEFLLNFIALSPKAGGVRQKFQNLLPTTVGLQLGNHLSTDAMDKMLASVEEWSLYPPERVSTMMADKVNRLMHDRFKQYINKVE
ncbi:hypothetical protein [Variovorax paradoxus]|uniref:hypothetical protein n=1 Tax=Variovorax paradoxus TaxID=34073 RepID=UPI003D655C72